MTGVSRETESRLRAYLALLVKWQEKINLVSPATIKDAWGRHFVDSIQIEALLPEGAKTLYDLGTGAGFPGLVLAVLRPELSVTLVESDSKKCAFLQTVSRETGTPVAIQNSRIEAAATELPAPDVITARALAPLESLLNYVRPWVEAAPDLVLIFPKGENWRSEIQAARAAGWTFDFTETKSETDKSARILTLKNVRKSPV